MIRESYQNDRMVVQQVSHWQSNHWTRQCCSCLQRPPLEFGKKTNGQRNDSDDGWATVQLLSDEPLSQVTTANVTNRLWSARLYIDHNSLGWIVVYGKTKSYVRSAFLRMKIAKGRSGEASIYISREDSLSLCLCVCVCENQTNDNWQVEIQLFSLSFFFLEIQQYTYEYIMVCGLGTSDMAKNVFCVRPEYSLKIDHLK